ncbi:hypothetical protein PIB30_087740 [Stylosanthes scabra]|uniref:DUF4283 domain-containing protein n=1 Tax=Stylosanthes scabra TaxID=79078 RepID=A0ABU6WTF6_9FABA|nr:hypothetical protein [Stylosanthes scabra]
MASPAVHLLDNSSEAITDEEWVVTFDDEDVREGVEKCKKSLIGSLLLDRSFSASALETTLFSIWRQPEGFRVLDQGGNLFQFFFAKEIDLIRLEKGAPWLFKNHILNLKRWSAKTVIREEEFATVPIWIQCWGSLPKHCKAKSLGWKIGGALGKEVKWGAWLRAYQFGWRSFPQKENLNPNRPKMAEEDENRPRKPTPVSLLRRFASLSVQNVGLKPHTEKNHEFEHNMKVIDKEYGAASSNSGDVNKELIETGDSAIHYSIAELPFSIGTCSLHGGRRGGKR